MSRKPGRVRLAFSDDESEALLQTHVMLRQRVLWVILLGAFLALFCLPTYRGLLLDQLYGVVTRQPPEWARVGVSVSGASRPRIQRVLCEYPGDRDLELGAMLLGDWRISTSPDQRIEREAIDLGSTRLRYLQGLTAKYPKDAVVLATYLRYCTQNAVRIQRRENDGKSTFKPIARTVLSQFEESCAKGAVLDPDNGYFSTLLAVARYAAGQDEAALAALHQASLATRWADYADAEMAGGKALLIRAYGDRGTILHAGPAAGVLLPHFAQIRGLARVAVRQADQFLDRGELERGHAIHADVVRLGGLMRESSRVMIGRLVGGAVEAIGLRRYPDPNHSAGTNEERKAAVCAQRQEYARRVAREAPAYAAEIERANREQDEFVNKRDKWTEGEEYTAWEKPLNALVWREILGLSLAANLTVCLLLWGGAAVFCLISWPKGEAKSTLVVWLWQRTPLLGRIPLFAVIGGVTILAILVADQGDAAGRLVLPALTLPLLLRVTTQPNSSTLSGRALVLIALGTLGAVAAFTYPWPMAELREGWWKEVVVSAALAGSNETKTEFTNTAFAYWLPSGMMLTVTLPAVVFTLALLRRWSLAQAAERLRLVAKGFAGLLAVSYLVYLLVAVPTGQLESRRWDGMMEREAQGVPF